jgi:hypothetical protein
LRKSGKRSPRRARKPKGRTRAPRPSAPVVATVTINGPLDSHALEALQLDLRRLARDCGLDVEGIQIETVEDG